MSLALPSLSRLQDLHDFNATPGAGNDGYVVTWDNATGKFILSVAAGGGASDVADLTATGFSANDMIRWDGTDFVKRTPAQVLSDIGAAASGHTHSYQPLDATLTALAGLATGADTLAYATGTDTFAQTTLTSVARTLISQTTQALMRTTGLGLDTMATQAASAVAITGGSLTGITDFRLANISGSMRFSGATAISQENSAATMRLLAELDKLHIAPQANAATNTIVNTIVSGFNSGGTAAAGFGHRLLFQLESSTTNDQDAAGIAVLWETATHASRSAGLAFSTVDNAGSLTEKLRLKSTGILDFLGTMGNSAKTVGIDAPIDWLEVKIGGVAGFVPVYAA